MKPRKAAPLSPAWLHYIRALAWCQFLQVRVMCIVSSGSYSVHKLLTEAFLHAACVFYLSLFPFFCPLTCPYSAWLPACHRTVLTFFFLCSLFSTRLMTLFCKLKITPHVHPPKCHKQCLNACIVIWLEFILKHHQHPKKNTFQKSGKDFQAVSHPFS